MPNEGLLRRKVEALTDEVNRLRELFHGGDMDAGARLPEARAKASRALQALWDACPGEKPPSQRVM